MIEEQLLLEYEKWASAEAKREDQNESEKSFYTGLSEAIGAESTALRGFVV